MKIFIITQSVPIYIPEFLDNFIEILNESSFIIAGIICLSPFHKKNFIKELKNRFNYYGLIAFIKMVIYILFNKFMSILWIFFPKMKCYSVENVINKYNIKKVNFKSINSKNFVEYIKSNKIDIILSIASPEIFKKEILSAPKIGCINYHSGLLPEYRGRQPLFWAMLNDEKEFGITIHEMDEKLDNGPIIVQKKFPINSKDSLHSLYKKSIKIGPKLLLDAINRIANNNCERIENNIKLAKYYSFPTKKDAKLFRKKGKKFI